MLRVGLTGGLGSGKSTVAETLRTLGAEVIEADELGRALMEPGQAVYAAIVHTFGSSVVGSDGRLNRARLAEIAFHDGRVNELNALVHPAVIAAQKRWMDEVFARNPAAARARGEKESVLADWRRRIDRVVVVTAPDEEKIARYAARVSPDGVGREAAQADARLRLTHQIPDAIKAARADYILENSGDKAALRAQVNELWHRLKTESNHSRGKESLE
jgi:dephospho-CoA kinase